MKIKTDKRIKTERLHVHADGTYLATPDYCGVWTEEAEPMTPGELAMWPMRVTFDDLAAMESRMD